MGTGIITESLSFIKENIKVILVSIVFIFCILYVNEKRQRASEKEAYEYIIKQNQLNLLVLNDSIDVKLNKANEKVSEKMSLVVSDINDISLYNKKLSEDVKKEIGNIQTYIKANIKADIGSNGVTVENISETDSIFTYRLINDYTDEGLNHIWESETDFFLVKNDDGTIDITNDTIRIIKNSFTLEVDLGIKSLGDTTIVFAKSKSKLIEFTDLQSVKIYTPVNINKNNKHWGVGPQIGGYITSDGKFTTAIGVGLTYNIFKF
jgi:hypothetical protein